MKTKKEKSFDAVKMMREIRDNISSETQNKFTAVKFHRALQSKCLYFWLVDC